MWHNISIYGCQCRVTLNYGFFDELLTAWYLGRIKCALHRLKWDHYWQHHPRALSLSYVPETLLNPQISSTDARSSNHDDVIKWKHFPRYWPFVRGIHRSPVNSPHKGQWRGALVFSFICVWINGWVNSRKAGELRRSRAHYDVIVMWLYRYDGIPESYPQQWLLGDMPYLEIYQTNLINFKIIIWYAAVGYWTLRIPRYIYDSSFWKCDLINGRTFDIFKRQG